MRRKSSLWGKKERLQNKIVENLSLGKRKREKMPVRRGNSTELKEKYRGRVRDISEVESLLFQDFIGKAGYF